ncbi:MAG: histidinol dehydrogenase [Candidatus Hydrogenedentes bacterium]|nr:histidinol dehydrogenase [Candidatus Hydrogenedentota bacterium]
MKTVTITTDAEFEAALDAVRSGGRDAASEARLKAQTDSTAAIVAAVRERGDAAVAELTERFDGVALTPDRFEVSPDELAAAVRDVDPELIAALERAHANIRRFHEKNLRQSWEEVSDDGTVLGQRLTAIDSAGVYVPGGKAFYVSSVLMNIVPARVAGVPEIVMVSPPSYEGTIHPLILAAARIAGATRVFRVGGAQAVAALAYGTERFPAVCKIAGPGNIYVTIAKRLVSAVCDIDKEAGPSEVVVIADDSADPRLVAMELLAQAEHEEEARAILVTPAPGLVEQVRAAIEEERASLSRADLIQKALAEQGVVYIVRDLEEAARLTSEIAPEHLSIQTGDPRGVFDRVRNVGCAVLGAMTPVAVGDYYAGPNHILPTGRRARFASPLTADDFRKVTSIISMSKEGLAAAYGDIRRIAEVEGFTAHARAVERRIR